MDRRGTVRNYLPLEINTADLSALQGLAGLTVEETSPSARAARLYRRAALEGPTADSYAMLWVAAECLSEKRTPSRPDIEAALKGPYASEWGPDSADALDRLAKRRPAQATPLLTSPKSARKGIEVASRQLPSSPPRRLSPLQREEPLKDAGLDPASFPVHVGLLIDLRGKVQHHGFDDLARLRIAFYEMEAVVRVLIRREMSITAGWWPASDPKAFAEPFSEAVATAMGPGETVWHTDALPPVTEAVPLRVPRRVARPEQDPRLQLDPALGDNRSIVARYVVDTLEWQMPDGQLSVHVGMPPGPPEYSGMVADPDSVWIPEDRLKGLTDSDRPQLLVNFMWDLTAIVGAALAQQAGIRSDGDGVIVVQAIAAWGQYLRLARFGPFDPSLLAIPAPEGPIALGTLVGWAAAGEDSARSSIDQLAGDVGRLCREVMAFLGVQFGEPPLSLLNHVGPRMGPR